MKRNPIGTVARIALYIALPVAAFVITVGLVMLLQNGSTPKDLQTAASSVREDPPRKNAASGGLIIKSLEACIKSSSSEAEKDPKNENDPDPENLEPTDPDFFSAYLVRLNLTSNVITIYTYDDNSEYTIPVKAMLCSPGLRVPEGTFTMGEQLRWVDLNSGLHGHYASYMADGLYFHAAPSTEEDESTVLVSQYNLLGTTYSHENIYLTSADAYWMYVNCTAYETQIEVGYFDADPLGKPIIMLLPTREETNWDPTAPSEDNPWNDYFPYFENVPESLTLTVGSELPDLSGSISAVDTCGYPVYYFAVFHSIDMNTPGDYVVTYAFTDALGREGVAYCTVHVIEKPEAPEESEIPEEGPSAEDSTPQTPTDPEPAEDPSTPEDSDSSTGEE